jgi:ATP-dependent Clp protease ATP-binding subunit ClpA
MLERFTTPARDAVMRARSEAQLAGHRFIGTEHLLLALLHPEAGRTATILGELGVELEGTRATVARLVGRPDQPLGPADAEALRSIGIDLDAVLASVEKTFGPGALGDPRDPEPLDGAVARQVSKGLFRRRRPGESKSARFSQRAKKTLELALREAVARKDNYIGTEHLLLGVIREGQGLGAQVLAEAGVDFAVLRSRLSLGMARPDAA